MKNASFLKCLLLGMSAVFLFFGCAKKSDGEGNTLFLYNWTYYTPDSVIKQFEAEYKVKVVYDEVPSNEEMYAKVKAGASGYDIVFPSQDYTSIMAKQDLLLKLDKSKIPNFKNIDPAVLALSVKYDPDNQYSVPYYMGAAGIAVNTTKIKNYKKDFTIFSDPQVKGHATMLDDMREVLGAALKTQGKSVNDTNDADLAAAQKLVHDSWVPNLLKFDAEAFAKGFASGDFWVVQGYAENIFKEYPADRRSEVDFFIPASGAPMYIDSMSILKSAAHPDLAYKFIDFIHRPEIYAEFCDSFGFPSTVNVPARALLKAKPNYTTDDLKAGELKLDLGNDLDKFNKVWEAIRVGK